MSLPKEALTAISVSETELNSRIFLGSPSTPCARLLSRSGALTEKISVAVSSNSLILFAVAEHLLHFLVGHRFPPVRIKDLNLCLQGPELWLRVVRFFRPYKVHYRHTPATDGHRLPIFHRLDQFRQFVLSVSDTEFHDSII